MAKSTRYVRANKAGGWEVLKEGHRRATALTDTKEKAVRRARDLAQREGGGEIRILNRYGKVADSRTVAPPRSTRRKSFKTSSSTARTARSRDPR